MKIKKITIIESKYQKDLFDASFFFSKEFTFSPTANLVYSNANSCGKTTFVRFLLHSLCFMKIPSTKEVRMSNYTTTLIVDNGISVLEIIRKGNTATIKNGSIVYTRNLENHSEELSTLSEIFNSDNPQFIKSILGIIYIDQDLGWNLVNRGKVIGEIFFDISNLISSLGTRDTVDFDSEIYSKNYEIKKYSALSKMAEFDNQDNNSGEIITDRDIYEKLLSEKSALQFEMKQISDNISEYQKTIAINDGIKDWVRDFQLLIKKDGIEPFVLKPEHLVDYTINKNIILSKIRFQKIEFQLIKEKISKVDNQLDKYRTIFPTDKIAQEIIFNIKNKINKPDLDELIARLKKEKKELNEKKELILKSSFAIVKILTESVLKYCEQLGIADKFHNLSDDVMSFNFNNYSGTILHKFVISFKISFLSLIEKILNIHLPIIIDSPGTGELRPEVVIEIIQFLNLNLSHSQYIISSVIPEIRNLFSPEQQIPLLNGIFDNIK